MRIIKKKRTLSLLLAAILTLSLLPVNAIAISDSTGQIGSYYAPTVDDSGEVRWTDAGTVDSVRDEAGGVTVQETIAGTETENEFDIVLKVTAADIPKNLSLSGDAAVVLVLDTSHNMTQAGAEQRAKIAAQTLVSGFARNAGDAKRLVSVVQFAEHAITVQPWTDAARSGAVNRINGTIDSAVHGAFVYHDCEIAGVHTHEEATIERSSYNQWKRTGKYVYTCTVCGKQAQYCMYHQHCVFPACTMPRDLEHKHRETYPGPHGAAHSSTGGANLEGGLQLASNLLAQLRSNPATDKLDRRYVVLLSDGAPTHSIAGDGADRESTALIRGAAADDARVAAATVAGQLRDDAMLYALSDTTDADERGWLEKSIADPKGFFDTADNEVPELAFTKIDRQLALLAQAWTVTAPLGEEMGFVRFHKNTGGAVCDPDSGTLHWDLKREPSTESGESYSLSYRVRLQTERAGFDESADHRIGGLTTLQYGVPVGGELPETLLRLLFYVPAVTGTIPLVDCSVEYYKWDKMTGAYPVSTGENRRPDAVQKAGAQKLGSEMTAPEGYPLRYSGQGYHFASCNFTDQAMVVTGEAAENVMKIFYLPDTTSAVIHRHFITHTTQPGGVVIDTEIQSQQTCDAYVMDAFTADTADTEGYRYAASVLCDGETRTSDNPTIDRLAAVTGETPVPNVIHLYYEKSIDARRDASYTICHRYAEQEWVLQADGKYALTTGAPHSGTPDTGTGKEGVVITAAPHTQDGVYTVIAPVTAEGLRFTLEAGDRNGLTIEYLKAPATVPADTRVQVNHYYTTHTTTIGGTTSDTESVTEREQVAKEGETWRFLPRERVGFDSGAVAAQEMTLNQNSPLYVVNFYYERSVDARKETTVTVNTIENVYTMQVDGDSGRADYVLTSTHAGTPKIETAHADGTRLYAGQTYAAAVAAPDGFALHAEASTPNRDSYPLGEAAAENVITLVYDRYVDELGEASVTVVHRYITYTDAVDDAGTVQKSAPSCFEEREPLHSGQVGEWFDVTERQSPETLPPVAPQIAYTRAPGQELRVTLTGIGAEKTVEYRRAVDLLTGTETEVAIRYFCVTITKQVVDGVVTVTDDRDTVLPLVEPREGVFYAGQRFSVSPAAERGAFLFDSALTGEKNGYQNLLLAGKTEENQTPNVIDLYYSKTVEKLPTAPVLIHDNYQTVRTYVNPEGVLVERKAEVAVAERAAVMPYIGTAYTAEPLVLDFVQTDAGYIPLEAPAAVCVEVQPGVNELDFYYTKTVNPTRPATVAVTHHYTGIDWDGSETVTVETEQIVTSAAGVVFTATKKELGYTLKNPEVCTRTLTAGENRIDLYYEQAIDSRVDTTVLVKHHYALTDAHVEGGLIAEGGFTKAYTSRTEGAFVGAVFLAPQRATAENGNTYTLRHATPDGGKMTLVAAAPEGEPANVIDLYYTRGYGEGEGFAVRGRQLCEGAPWRPDATIYLTREGEDRYSATVNTDTGDFLFAGVAPGVYGIRADAAVPGYSCSSRYELTTRRTSPAEELSLPTVVTDLTVVAATEYLLTVTSSYTKVAEPPVVPPEPPIVPPEPPVVPPELPIVPPEPPIVPPEPPIVPPEPPVAPPEPPVVPPEPPIVPPEPPIVPSDERQGMPETERPLTPLPEETVPLSDAPNTRDAQHPGLWLSMALAAALGMVLVTRRKSET